MNENTCSIRQEGDGNRYFKSGNQVCNGNVTYVISFNTYNMPLGKALCLFYRWENWESEQLRNFSKCTQLDRDSNLHTVPTDLRYLPWISKYLPASLTSDVSSLEKKNTTGKKGRKRKGRIVFFFNLSTNWASTADIADWILRVMAIEAYTENGKETHW